MSDSILPPSLWTSCGCRKVEFRGVEVRPAHLIDQPPVRLVDAAAANELFFFTFNYFSFCFRLGCLNLIIIYLMSLKVKYLNYVSTLEETDAAINCWQNSKVFTC